MPRTLFRPSAEADKRFRTLEIRASVSVDENALGRLFRRAASLRGVPTAVFELHGKDRTREARQRWHVWWEPPSLWRDDRTSENGETDVALVRGDNALIYVASQRMMDTSEPAAANSPYETVPAPRGITELPTISNRTALFPLVQPNLPGSEWDFHTVADHELYDGHPVRRVRATRRASTSSPEEHERSGYWRGVNEYECLVDDAHHILVSLVGIAEGARVGEIAAESIVIDAPFTPDVFSFAPPPNTRVVHVRRRA